MNLRAGGGGALCRRGGRILEAEDSTYGGGYGGIEGSGSDTRLTNFKLGVPLTAVSGMGAALKALPLVDPFSTTETHLSAGGDWAALLWDTSPDGYATGRVAGGWGPSDAFSTVNGAFWQPTPFSDTGSGNAVEATVSALPGLTERYFSLILDSANPATARSGYELRFLETAPATFTASLLKQPGSVVLASKTGYAMVAGTQIALAEKGEGTISAWVSINGGEFTQLLSATDTAYGSGFIGIEGAGNNTRLTNLRAGELAPW